MSVSEFHSLPTVAAFHIQAAFCIRGDEMT